MPDNDGKMENSIHETLLNKTIYNIQGDWAKITPTFISEFVWIFWLREFQTLLYTDFVKKKKDKTLERCNTHDKSEIIHQPGLAIYSAVKSNFYYY